MHISVSAGQFLVGNEHGTLMRFQIKDSVCI